MSIIGKVRLSGQTIQSSSAIVSVQIPNWASPLAGNWPSQAVLQENLKRELLTYSRPTENTVTLVKIDELIRSMLSRMNQEIKKHQIEVVLDLEASPQIYVDESLLNHALMNLISNAIDAMPMGGVLSIESRMAKKLTQMEILVNDTGTGIPRDKIDKVFKPFFTTKPKGLGVGLSLTRRIIERHGGTMHLESQEGKGTTVTIQFPISR